MEIEMPFPNKFAAPCSSCRAPVAAGAGLCEKINGAWQVRCAAPCEPKAAPALPEAAVGDLSGIMALFARAGQHLKVPAVELGVPGFPVDRAVRVSVATDRARFPGSLTLLTAAKFGVGKEFPERKWLGRIYKDGTLIAGRGLTTEPAFYAAVEGRLKAFAADPSKVGAEDGLLTGRCCFCRKALTAEKSTAVGYGKKCASNFGLAWGAKPAGFAGSLVALAAAFDDRTLAAEPKFELEVGVDERLETAGYAPAV